MAMTLVTGASGFVGTHLMAEMRRRELPVRGVTRGTAEGLVSVPNYGADMDWSECLEGVDTIIHLAARVHVMKETAQDPLALFRAANVDATINLAQQAAKAGVKRFVFVSSIGVNGNKTLPGKPFSVSDTPAPHSPYAVSKYEAEEALKTICQTTGLEFVIIRPPLVYGPGAPGNFNKLLSAASKGIPSPFKGLTARRSFIYIGNLCDLIIRSTHAIGATNKLFVASDVKSVTVNELYQLLASSIGQMPICLSVPPRLLQLGLRMLGKKEMIDQLLTSLEVDSAETQIALDWVPRISIFEGILATGQAWKATRS